MRKNTAECLRAFTTGTAHHGDRDTIVILANGTVEWCLHGNTIAQLCGDRLLLTTARWNTATTWDRLNTLSRAYGVTFDRAESIKHFPDNLQTKAFTLTEGAQNV